MTGPSDNTRRALRGHLEHLLDLTDKARGICGAADKNGARVSHQTGSDVARRDEVLSLLDSFQQEVLRASAEWAVDLGVGRIDPTRGLAVTLQFVDIALEEMSSARLSGFGTIDPAFEKAYEAFLQMLHIRLDAMLQLVEVKPAGQPSP